MVSRSKILFKILIEKNVKFLFCDTEEWRPSTFRNSISRNRLRYILLRILKSKTVENFEIKHPFYLIFNIIVRLLPIPNVK